MSDSIPTWLSKPPTGPMVVPPTETRSQTLPFSDLSWEDFECLLLRLARRQGDIAHCSLYGTRGQAQEGLDIVAIDGSSGETICFQCKNVISFNATDISDSVNKFLSGKWAKETSQFILCVSISLGTTQQQDEIVTQQKELASQGITFAVWDGAPGGILSELLKTLPELVDDFFGRPWVKHFNGEDAAASLGDRLDGRDLRHLRSRLYRLYTSVFNQHDPGLRLSGLKRSRYTERYVPIDFTEHTDITVLLHSKDEVGEIESSGGLPTVPDGTLLEPTPPRIGHGTYQSRRPAFEWLSAKQHCVVLGEPGSGKSALLRYLALSLLIPDSGKEHAFNGQYAGHLPVWISFARYAAVIEHQPNASVSDFIEDWLHQLSFDDISPLFRRALRHSKVLLLIDGLDEGASQSHRQEALDRIITFVQSSESAAICTSRPRGFNRVGMPDTWNIAVIAPMNDSQIQELAARWFSLKEMSEEDCDKNGTADQQARHRAGMFLRVAKEHGRTRELARNPLLCHALIELFRFSHRLPEARVGVYDKIIELLISQHPAARAHAAHSETPIRLLGVQETDLREILIRIADNFQDSVTANIFPGDKCRQICAGFLEDDIFGLGLKRPEAKRLARDIVEQLIEQYGLLVERSPDDVGFVHLSIQEYLAAESISRMEDADQLDWLERVWLQPKWRECVTNWFGIQGSRGNKGLTGKAAERLTELGREGEWQRLQSIELRTELACTDLGIPVGESRKAVREAARSVEASPFPSHRTTLAHYVTLGAVSSGVKSECLAAVRRWVPGRPSYSRASLLKSFQSWQASDDLHETLLRGLQDEHTHCRLAALDSLIEVFGPSRELGCKLYRLSLHDPRPEVRAIGLKGLARCLEWSDMAKTSSLANLKSGSAELLLSACDVRVRLGLANDEDLQRIWSIWSAGAADYRLGKDFVDTLCSGWPSHNGIRSAFTAALERETSSLDREVPLVYLLRCYPMDEEVASLTASLFNRYKDHVALDMGPIWRALIDNFKGFKTVATAVRRVLQARKEKYEAIYWHPQTTPGLVVIGDDLARDELIEAYLSIAPDMGRYWIANALMDGWWADEKVKAALTDWGSLGPGEAAPLASWAAKLYPDPSERREWLTRLVEGAPGRLVRMPIESLLKEFSDNESRELVENRVNDEKIWYYSRIRIEGCLARNFPLRPSSLGVARRALDEIDGPQLSDFAISYEKHETLREEILGAAVPAPEDVRRAVAETIQDRAFDLETIARLTPSMFAEETGQIRTMAVIAKARASTGNNEPERYLLDALMEELTSLGTYYESRKCTALAALIELGQAEKAISALAEIKGASWHNCLPDSLNRDTASLGIICERWQDVKPLLAVAGLEPTLPVSRLIHDGYGAILERGPLARQDLDDHLRSIGVQNDNWHQLVECARRFPNSAFLKEKLINVFSGRDQDYFFSNRSQYVAARLVKEHFGSDREVLSRLCGKLGLHENGFSRTRAGVVAVLSLGWPSSELGQHLRKFSMEEKKRWALRDQLLTATALREWVDAENAAIELLKDPLGDWRYRVEDVEALRLWAREEAAVSTLGRWVASDDGTLSTTGLALVGGERLIRLMSVEEVIGRFNEEMSKCACPPMDGLDVLNGSVTSWVNRAMTIIHDSNRSGSFN